MVHVLKDDFEFFLAIVHRSLSSTTLLMIVPIFSNFLPLFPLHRSPRWCIGWECFLPSTSASSFRGTTVLIVYSSFIWVISTLEIALANIHPDVLVLLDVADVHQCSKADFPFCCFVCLFHDFFTFLFHCCLASRINIAWGGRSFVHASRFPEASVSERQFFSVF